MDLTKGQSQAVTMVQNQLKEGHSGNTKTTILAGFAGTGKTTMLKVLNSVIGELCILTPTGKAAIRVTEATGLDASTVHRWMYRPTELPSGDVEFTLKPTDEIYAPASGLVVVDEASMLTKDMYLDILGVCQQIGCHLLLVGDPFQLPPVGDNFSVFNNDFNVFDKVTLTEVLRQALDNPIIRVSMAIRQSDPLEALYDLDFVSPTKAFAKAAEIVSQKGAVIVHRNNTRHLFNRENRKVLGLGDAIIKGEPLLVLKNNYQANLYNGELFEFPGWNYLTPNGVTIHDTWAKLTGHSKFGRITYGGVDLALSESEIHGNLESFSYKSKSTASRKAVGKFPLIEANFGYCLTCHKAQGSEWAQTLTVLEPSVRLDQKDGRRWLYTAITRASKNTWISWGGKYD
jgi:exodeoxyribonuclease-5